MAATSLPKTATPANYAKVKVRGTAGFFEYLSIAIDSLRGNKLRSFLTLLGIIIGITFIITVITIIEGLDRYWKDKVSNLGPNTFVISQFAITTNPDEYFKMLKRNPEIRSLEADGLRKLCTACEAVGVETHKQVMIKAGGQTLENVDLGGITPNIMDIEGHQTGEGRNLLDWEDDHARFATYIGWEIADRLFPTVDPIGKEIQIEDHWYTVVGVGEKKGTVFGVSRDNYVKIPLSTFQKIYGSRRSVNISVKAREGQLHEAQDQARQIMRNQHRLNYKEEDDFGVITSEGMNQLFDNLTRVIFSVMLFVVGISLVVGGIVVMNIMLVSVVERTKEIGIRKAIGARQQDVVNQFMIESIVLCSVGGAIGVAIAYLFSWLIGNFTPLPAVFPMWAPFLAIGLSTVIGIFFGIYPARRAGSLDPIEALRAE
ncbi:MAG: ABC transporter permease [Acidobacteriota bacterium]